MAHINRFFKASILIIVLNIFNNFLKAQILFSWINLSSKPNKKIPQNNSLNRLNFENNTERSKVSRPYPWRNAVETVTASGCRRAHRGQGNNLPKRDTCWPEQSLQAGALKEPPLKKPCGFTYLGGPGRYQQHLWHHVTIWNAYSYLKMRGRTCWVIPGVDSQPQHANILTCPIGYW